jgi:GAF domain-containing protein
VAELSIQQNLRHTLDEIIKGICDVLGCDVVTLFVYNPDTKRLEPPPAMVGVRHPEQVMCYVGIAENSVVYEMLRRDEPYIVDTVAQDERWRNLRFSKEEVYCPTRNETKGVEIN